MIWRLVLRNIVRNKKDSGIIMLLIGVITCLFFIGNSILEQTDQGLEGAYVDSLTGDVIIQRTGDVTMNLFGANAPMMEDFFKIPPLPAYDKIKNIAAAETGIMGMTSQVSGQAVMDMLGVREGALLCGVDAETYFNLFTGIIIQEGRALKSGEYGAMITAQRADRIQEKTGTRPVPGDTMLFTAAGLGGFKIRSATLTGIFRYQNPGQFMEEIVLTDPQTVRALVSILQVASSKLEMSADEVSILQTSDVNVDNLFGEDFAQGMEGQGTIGRDTFSVAAMQTRLKAGITAAEEDDEEDAPVSLVGGDWNFILLRLEEGVSALRFIFDLNKKLAPYGATAGGWRIGAGESALLLLVLQGLCNLGVMLVCVVGVLVILNILLISVFRRTREIGTLRAIGASDAYIRILIIGENCVLAVLAGILGIILGVCCLAISNRMAIVIENPLIASLLGEKVLHIAFLPDVAALSFLVAVVIGIAASLYPMWAAVRIEPVVAMRKT
jgi:ABC-type lipoprotein release transport system permease subunit